MDPDLVYVSTTPGTTPGKFCQRWVVRYRHGIEDQEDWFWCDNDGTENGTWEGMKHATIYNSSAEAETEAADIRRFLHRKSNTMLIRTLGDIATAREALDNLQLKLERIDELEHRLRMLENPDVVVSIRLTAPGFREEVYEAQVSLAGLEIARLKARLGENRQAVAQMNLRLVQG